MVFEQRFKSLEVKDPSHLLHSLPGVAGESDGHRLKVDDEGPLVVSRDETGGDVLAHGQREHEQRRSGCNLSWFMPQLQKRHLKQQLRT